MTDTPQVTAPGPQEVSDQENARLIAQFAHHDIWWYRSNQWNAANWALLLIAALVAVARMFLQEDELTWSSTWHLAVLVLVAGTVSSWYLAHLHMETIETRRLMRQANRLGGAEQLRTKIWNRTYEKTDHRRGALLVLVMNVSIGVAVGVAVAYLAHLYWLG